MLKDEIEGLLSHEGSKRSNNIIMLDMLKHIMMVYPANKYGGKANEKCQEGLPVVKTGC